MKPSLLKMIAVAQRHGEVESGQDVDAIMATMEGEPVYEFFPLHKRFSGIANTRRYYEHFVDDVQKRMVGFTLNSESVGTQGVVQEYTITLVHDGDDEPSTHRIMAILVFGETGLTGERMFSDEKLFRTILGPLWDEMEPIVLQTSANAETAA